MNTQVYIYRGQVIFEMGDSKLASFCVQHAAFMESKEKGAAEPGEGGGDASAASMNQSVTQRAVVFSFLKNYAKAISVLDYELRLKPSGEIFNLLGRVYMKAKRWPEAVATFERSIENNVSRVASVCLEWGNLLFIRWQGVFFLLADFFWGRNKKKDCVFKKLTKKI